MIKNMLKTFPWALAFLAFVATLPFIIFGYWMMKFMDLLTEED